MQKKFVKTEETKCENCAFYEACPAIITPNSKTSKGYCHRYPKKMINHWRSFFDTHTTVTAWITMKCDDWCGEFLKKAGKQ